MSFSDVSGELAERLQKIREKQASAAQAGPVDFEELYTLRARILGVLIRDARQARSRSAAECAAHLGVEEQTFLDWELGHQHPSLPQLELLAYDLGLPVSHFWGTQTLSRDGSAHRLPQDEYLSLRDRLVGIQIRTARTEAGLSLAALGEMVNLPAGDLNAYELGQKAVPLTELVSIATATKVRLSQFMESGNRVGQWLDLQETFRHFTDLPEDIRQFISTPSNRSFITLAMWFSTLEVKDLRGIAESILNLSRLESNKLQKLAEHILNDITL